MKENVSEILIISRGKKKKLGRGMFGAFLGSITIYGYLMFQNNSN
jgi:hypothetical protein